MTLSRAVDNVESVVHTDAVAEPPDFPRRVFIEDLCRDGMFLRVTWHCEHSAFVVSHWQGEVCVAATRVAATDVAEGTRSYDADTMTETIDVQTYPSPL